MPPSDMGKLHLLLAALLGVLYISQDGIFGLEVEMTVRPGDNITLYCDYRAPPGDYMSWFRNCSHNNQPALEMPLRIPDSNVDISYQSQSSSYPCFNFKWNQSTASFDLLIKNVTESNLGLYYCGPEQTVMQKDQNSITKLYTTRILFNYSLTEIKSDNGVSCDCSVSWLLLVLSRLLLFLLLPSAYYIGTICESNRRRREERQRRNSDTRVTSQGRHADHQGHSPRARRGQGSQATVTTGNPSNRGILTA